MSLGTVATTICCGEGSSPMLRDEMLDGQADATDPGKACSGGNIERDSPGGGSGKGG